MDQKFTNSSQKRPDRKGRLEGEASDHRRSLDDTGDGLDFPCGDAPKAGTVKAVADGILWVRMPLPWSLDHINLYLIDRGDSWLLVDTGVASEETKEFWKQIFSSELDGKPIEKVLITHHHPDHLGLAGWIAERFSAPIMASRQAFLLARSLTLDIRDEAPEEALIFSRRAGFTHEMVEKQRKGGWGNFAKGVFPLPIGYERIAGGDMLNTGDVSWHLIETGGHAPGHISLYSSDRNILVSGDQVLPKISSNVSVYPTEPMGNPLEEWLDGLARLRALPHDVLVLPSHNEPFYGLHRRLNALIDKHVGRLNGVVDLCKAPSSAIEVFPALFRRRVSGLEFAMATGEALAHLHFLENLGVVAREEEDGIARFTQIADYDENAVREHLQKITDQTREMAAWEA